MPNNVLFFLSKKCKTKNIFITLWTVKQIETMKIGDYVRFLNETGGGKITAFQGKNIVLVEDEDGFEIPMMTNEVVVVDDGDGEKDRKPTYKAPQYIKKAEEPKADTEKEKTATQPLTAPEPVWERQGGDALSAYLAFVPVDIKEITQTRFETYLVNDSNYFLNYTYLSAEGNSWTLRAQGELEPNTKECVEEFGRDILNDFERVCIQVIAYKRDKPFMLKPAIEAQIRIDPVKFYKLHTFQENDFFDTPALLYTIMENDEVKRPLVIDARQLKQELYAKNDEARQDNTAVRKFDTTRARHADPGIIVIDLHAHELLETEAGMSAADILNYQIETFRKTLEQYKKRKGQRIVFIHGKGEGVLRQALIHELKYRYKQYTYQDASFKEYGYGATQVTIK